MALIIRILIFLSFALLFLLPVSCADGRYKVRIPKNEERCGFINNLFGRNDEGVRESGDKSVFKAAYLVAQLEYYGYLYKDDRKIIVTTFVDLNNLNRTTKFGRILAEDTSSELHKRGFKVADVRETGTIQMAENFGEFFLSRGPVRKDTYTKDVLPQPSKKKSSKKTKKKSSDKPQDPARKSYPDTLVLAGTYEVGPCDVFINARIIDPGKSEVLAAASYRLHLTNDLRYLLSHPDELKDSNSGVQIRQRKR
ncbi:MAG: FlgO family outer membrane protein [Nitrospirae bacterium YQR-1]